MKIKGKLLIFCPYYHPHIGGLESHADEFNKHISQEGYDITVFTTRLPKSAPSQEEKYSNVKIIRFPAFEIIPNWFLPKFWTNEYRNQYKKLLEENFDIVISRTRFFSTSLTALIYSKRKKVRFIHIEHGSDYVQLSNKIYSLIAHLYDDTVGRLVLKNADEVIANSNASAKFCKKLYDRRSYSVIYRGIESDEIINAVANKEIQRKYEKTIKIAYIGRLIDGKGIIDLLDACSRLNIRQWVLFIIGDGPQKKELQHQCKKLGIGNKVIFTGQKNKKESIGVIKACDIVVNPSYTEGLPTSVIEAALCSRAIIATNVGGTNEIIDKDEGILVPAKKPKILAQKIDELANNKEYRIKLGSNAKRKALTIFSWQISAEKYLKIFEKYA